MYSATGMTKELLAKLLATTLVGGALGFVAADSVNPDIKSTYIRAEGQGYTARIKAAQSRSNIIYESVVTSLEALRRAKRPTTTTFVTTTSSVTVP